MSAKPVGDYSTTRNVAAYPPASALVVAYEYSVVTPPNAFSPTDWGSEIGGHASDFVQPGGSAEAISGDAVVGNNGSRHDVTTPIPGTLRTFELILRRRATPTNSVFITLPDGGGGFGFASISADGSTIDLPTGAQITTSAASIGDILHLFVETDGSTTTDVYAFRNGTSIGSQTMARGTGLATQREINPETGWSIVSRRYYSRTLTSTERTDMVAEPWAVVGAILSGANFDRSASSVTDSVGAAAVLVTVPPIVATIAGAALSELALSGGPTATLSGAGNFDRTAASVTDSLGSASATYGAARTAASATDSLGSASATYGAVRSAVSVTDTVGAAGAGAGVSRTAASVTDSLGSASAAYGAVRPAASVTDSLGSASATYGATRTAVSVTDSLGSASAAYGAVRTAASVTDTVGVADTSETRSAASVTDTAASATGTVGVFRSAASVTDTVAGATGLANYNRAAACVVDVQASANLDSGRRRGGAGPASRTARPRLQVVETRPAPRKKPRDEEELAILLALV